MKRSITLATLATLGVLATSVGLAQSTEQKAPATKANTQQPAAKPAPAPAAQATAAPAKPATQSATKPASKPKAMLVDLNTATREQLVAVAGIGDTYADAIIKARPFKSRSELLSKKVIPAAAYKKVRAHVTAKHQS